VRLQGSNSEEEIVLRMLILGCVVAVSMVLLAGAPIHTAEPVVIAGTDWSIVA